MLGLLVPGVKMGGGTAVVVVVPGDVGIQYTMPLDRGTFALREDRGHFTVPTDRGHFTLIGTDS